MFDCAPLSVMQLTCCPCTPTQLQVTSEIGDTWIYGVASDPRKVAEYRELLRWRKAAMQQYGAAALARFDQLLVKLPEHTWSVSVQHLGRDVSTYRNDVLHAEVGTTGLAANVCAGLPSGLCPTCGLYPACALCRPLQLAKRPLPDNINVTVHSWERQRNYIRWAVAALGERSCA